LEALPQPGQCPIPVGEAGAVKDAVQLSVAQVGIRLTNDFSREITIFARSTPAWQPIVHPGRLPIIRVNSRLLNEIRKPVGRH
jgi:hypothetical protein